MFSNIKRQLRLHLSNNLKPRRHWLWALSFPLIVAPTALADQFPANLTGWYQTHDGRVYKIRQRRRNVWLTRYDASNGMPLTYFEGRINAEANKIEGKIQSCYYSGRDLLYGAGEKPFTFTAKNTDAQKSLGFSQADGKWIQFYPRYPLQNLRQSWVTCNLAKLAQSTWLSGKDRDSRLALYRAKADPLIYWVYSLDRYRIKQNEGVEGVGRWADRPIARLDYRSTGSHLNPSDTYFEVYHCYDGIQDAIKEELKRKNRSARALVSLTRTGSNTFELRRFRGTGLFYKIYDPSEYPIRWNDWHPTDTSEEKIELKGISGITGQPKFIYQDERGRRRTTPFFDSTFFANPDLNTPAAQTCRYQ